MTEWRSTCLPSSRNRCHGPVFAYASHGRHDNIFPCYVNEATNPTLTTNTALFEELIACSASSLERFPELQLYSNLDSNLEQPTNSQAIWLPARPTQMILRATNFSMSQTSQLS